MGDVRVLLGFEVETGKEVEMKLHHTVITGMTQLSGKTTALEAIIARSGRRAIAFKTKRGEAGFNAYHEVPPFFRERADWQYVASLLEAIMRERMKFERPWIMRATKGAKTLREVQENVSRLREESRDGSLPENVYTALEEYLKIVVPQIDKFSFSKELELAEGINVMDITQMSVELQSLVIRSTMEHVISEMRDLVVIIPEAWEHLPQGRNTPVKLYAETFIRKGAAIGNFLFIDSQDIAGVDKTPLRQCNNWVMGRQREAHEVERVREHIGKNKVSAEEIRSLPLGHFYASIGNQLKKVYVLPAGVPPEVGRKIAKGELGVEAARGYMTRPYVLRGGTDQGSDGEASGYSQRIGELEEQVKAGAAVASGLMAEIEGLRKALEGRDSQVEMLRKRVEDLSDPSRGRHKTIEGLSPDELNLLIDARVHQIMQHDPPSRLVSIDVSNRFREIIRENFIEDISEGLKTLGAEHVKAAIVVHELGEIKRGDLYSMVRGKTGRIPEDFYQMIQGLEDAHVVSYNKKTGVVSWSLGNYVDDRLSDLYEEEARKEVKDYLASLLLPH